jgi:hypothetical protein
MCNTSKNGYDYEKLHNFLEDTIEPKELASHLEEVEFRYATHFLEQSDFSGPFKEEAANLYYLRELRKAIEAMHSKPH